MWAQIEKKEVIEEGHGVTRVEDEGKSPYTVTFEKPVIQCAVVATVDENFTNYVVTDVHPQPAEPNKVHVYIEELVKGTDQESGFSIIAVC